MTAASRGLAVTQAHCTFALGGFDARQLKSMTLTNFFRTWYGPTQRGFAASDEAGQAVLRRAPEQPWTEHNGATDGTTRIAAEYLEVSTDKHPKSQIQAQGDD